MLALYYIVVVSYQFLEWLSIATALVKLQIACKIMDSFKYFLGRHPVNLRYKIFKCIIIKA